MKNKTQFMVLCGLFAALTAVGSWLSIPLPFTPVPINLATIIVFLAGGLLGPKYGTISMAVYTLLGAVGAPVFHSFTSGLGILVGPTGGYIIGYIACAFIIGIIIKKGKKNSLPTTVIAIALGLLSIYILGTAWFIILTGSTLGAALIACVVPFLIGDTLKIIVSALLIIKLRPRLGTDGL